jgi:hypothetical protein
MYRQWLPAGTSKNFTILYISGLLRLFLTKKISQYYKYLMHASFRFSVRHDGCFASFITLFSAGRAPA